MGRVPRRPFAALALALLAAAPATAEEPPPPKKPVPTRIPVVEFPGVRWERDFGEGMRRAAREGRPVLFAVNALVDAGEGGNVAAARGSYPTKEMGEGSRPWVCFVGNPNDHEDRTLADGSKVCGRYGWGACACHKEALAWLLRHHTPDGETVVSPSHWALEPDGKVHWQEDYVQGTPSGERLEAMCAEISPRLALRRVWTTREARLAALAKVPADRLEKAARDWLVEGDVLAATGLVAALDQEGDAARRKALFAALASAGPKAAPLVFDSVDGATSNPDADPEAALAWTTLALALDGKTGGWALGRGIARAKDEALRKRFEALLGADPAAAEAVAPFVRARAAEARLLRGDRGGEEWLRDKASDAIPAARLERARRAAGVAAGKDPEDWWHDRDAILRATPERAKRAADELRLLLEKKATPTDVRVAAAIALRRAGDATGVPILLWALADGIEGPEARAALAKDAGQDRGDDPSAWEGWLRGGDGAGGGGGEGGK